MSVRQWSSFFNIENNPSTKTAKRDTKPKHYIRTIFLNASLLFTNDLFLFMSSASHVLPAFNSTLACAFKWLQGRVLLPFTNYAVIYLKLNLKERCLELFSKNGFLNNKRVL